MTSRSSATGVVRVVGPLAEWVILLALWLVAAAATALRNAGAFCRTPGSWRS